MSASGPPGGQVPGGTPPGPGQPRRRASLYGERWPGWPARPSRPRRPGLDWWFKRVGPWVALGLVVLISGVFGYVLFTLRDLPDPGQIPVLELAAAPSPSTPADRPESVVSLPVAVSCGSTSREMTFPSSS